MTVARNVSQRRRAPERGLRDADPEGAPARSRRERLAAELDWVSTREAARILGVSYSTLGGLELPSVRRRLPESALGPQCAGWLWHREDLVRVRLIRARCRLGIMGASRVDAAIPGLIEHYRLEHATP